jgi:multiple sugar transport system substrate-binding protein
LYTAFVLVGCADNNSSPQHTTGPIELTYWPAPNAQEIQLADTLVKAWNRLHPGIQVRMQPIPVSQSTEEVLLAAIAGRTTPDVCSNIWPGALHDYTQAGGLVSLDHFADFDSIVGARTPRQLLETFRSADGHYYQLPWKSNPVMMFYNQRLFEEAGVQHVPRTYGEYLAAGKRVSRDTDGDGKIDIWMGERDIRPIWWQRLFDFYPFYLAASSGRTLFEGGAVAFENIEAAEVFAFFQECYRRKYFPQTYFQAGDPFLLEKKATHFAGPWEIAHIQKFAPQIRFGVVSLPVPDAQVGPSYTYGDFKNIAIFSNTGHLREAWEFVKYLITPQHDLLMLEICGQLPVRGDLLSNPLFAGYFERNPMMVRFAERVPFTRGVDPVPDLKEILDAISQSYEKCAVYGRISPDEAVREAARRTRVIMEWNK